MAAIPAATSLITPPHEASTDYVVARYEPGFLRFFTKLMCIVVLGLILKGALVTSHDAGLAVPDWPTTFGENMFTFHPSKWVGIIFYEHVHRLYAALVGLFTVILALWVWWVEPRRWVRVLAYATVGLVLIQGALGGLTVRLLLATATSSAHAVLAQTFFVCMIILAYSQSKECLARGSTHAVTAASIRSGVARATVVLVLSVYLQLILGAVMRHAGAGLAVLDFPTMGGFLIPQLSDQMVTNANTLRSALGFAPVSSAQIALNLIHRVGAVFIASAILVLIGVTASGARARSLQPKVFGTVIGLVLLVVLQITLGIGTVLLLRQPWVASLHVMTGAAVLATSVLLMLRCVPWFERRPLSSTLVSGAIVKK